MNPETSSTALPCNRMLTLLSIGLLAVAIFGLVRLGFGVVPVWILAVPPVLLACMDIENRFARIDSIATRFGVVAFHFVIVATVVAAHQQIGGTLNAGYGKRDASGIAAKGEAGGCGAGGCGSSFGGCGGACGSSGGTHASASSSGSKSACGCGSGKSASGTAQTRTASGTKRMAVNAPPFSAPIANAMSAKVPGTGSRAQGAERPALIVPATVAAAGPKLGAGLVPDVKSGGVRSNGAPSPPSTTVEVASPKPSPLPLAPASASATGVPKPPMPVPAVRQFPPQSFPGPSAPPVSPATQPDAAKTPTAPSDAMPASGESLANKP